MCVPCKRKQLHPDVKEPDLDCPLIVDLVVAPFTQSAGTGTKGQALNLRNAHSGYTLEGFECSVEQGVLGYSRWVCQTLSDNLLSIGIADQQAWS